MSCTQAVKRISQDRLFQVVQKLYGSVEFVNVNAAEELIDLLTQDVQP